MININLTEKQKEALELQHKKARDKHECDRIKAVLLNDEGWSTTMIAQALRKHEASITRHLNDYIQDEKLTSENGGSKSHLNQEQTQVLIQHLTQVTYLLQHQIVAYIKKTFDVEYSVSGLNKWLHYNGFGYKKPKGVPHKFDVEKQAAFIEHYEVLKASLHDDEPLLFMDNGMDPLHFLAAL